MKNLSLRVIGLCVLAIGASALFGHGLIQDPPSRNWICGFITKPDHVQNGVSSKSLNDSALPVCHTNPGLVIQYLKSWVSEKCGPQEMLQTKLRGPAVIGCVGQSIGTSQGTTRFGKLSELKLQTFSRGPTPSRPVVCVSTLMKL